MRAPDALLQKKVHDILESATKVPVLSSVKEVIRPSFEDVSLYLVDKETKEKIEHLEKELTNEETSGSYKSKTLYPYLKLINPECPAYKYSFFVKKRAFEIFDRDKVYDRIEGELARYINKEKLKLSKHIEKRLPPYSKEESSYLHKKLDDRLLIDSQTIKRVKENYEDYDVVLSNHEHCNTYPSLYYTLDLSYGEQKVVGKKKDYKKENTHLRTGVPNILWLDESRKHKELRANNKIEKIISTHTSYCDTIYIKNRIV